MREGKRIRTIHLDVRIVASPLATPRVGIVVPLHQRTAVERNLVKRRLRELVRTRLLPVLRAQTSVDVSIRARREAYAASFEQLRIDIDKVRERFAVDEGRN